MGTISNEGAAVRRRLEKWAWVLLFLPALGGATFSLVFLFSGPTDLMTQELVGQAWAQWSAQQPDAAGLAELGFGLAGVNGFLVGVFGMVIAAGPYRRGERWAWYLLLLFPVLLLGAQYVNLKTGLGMDVDFPVLLAVMAAGLILPLRRFFGSRTDAAADPQSNSQDPMRPQSDR